MSTAPRARDRVAASFVLAASAALLLSGCAERPDPPEQERTALGEFIPYTGDMTPLFPLEWNDVEVDGNQVRIEYAFNHSGSEPVNDCSQYAARVTETPDSVTIDLYKGRLTGTEGLCDERKPGLFERREIIDLFSAGASHTILVELDAPLGDRTLREGHWMPDK